MGSGLIGLHTEVTPIGQSFTVSRNWLTLGGAVHPSQQDPRIAKHQNKNTCLTQAFLSLSMCCHLCVSWPWTYHPGSKKQVC